MPLVLHPDVTEFIAKEGRAAYEEYLNGVRMRRLLAAMEHANKTGLKLQNQADKARRLMQSDYDMLGKELESLDKALQRVERRVQSIDMRKAEEGMVEDTLAALGARR